MRCATFIAAPSRVNRSTSSTQMYDDSSARPSVAAGSTGDKSQPRRSRMTGSGPASISGFPGSASARRLRPAEAPISRRRTRRDGSSRESAQRSSAALPGSLVWGVCPRLARRAGRSAARALITSRRKAARSPAVTGAVPPRVGSRMATRGACRSSARRCTADITRRPGKSPNRTSPLSSAASAPPCRASSTADCRISAATGLPAAATTSRCHLRAVTIGTNASSCGRGASLTMSPR